MKPKILVKFFTETASQLDQPLKQSLETFYHCPVEMETLRWDISSAYNQNRKQYLSHRLLTALSQFNHVPGEHCLGVFDVDLYSPGNRYIFGDADISTGAAIISLFRLIPKPNQISGPGTFMRESAIKIAVHQLGYTFYLSQCPDSRCLMSSSDAAIAHDMTRAHFCPTCQSKLSGITQHPYP